jgi:hypothetical protein
LVNKEINASHNVILDLFAAIAAHRKATSSDNKNIIGSRLNKSIKNTLQRISDL